MGECIDKFQSIDFADKLKSIHLINEIQTALLNSMHNAAKEDFLQNATDGIHSILKCTECSLWSINHYKRIIDKNFTTKDELSTSLIYRKLDNAIDYVFDNAEDFVHDLNGCFFNKGTASNNPNYFKCNKEEAKANHYRSPGFLDAAGIESLILIPIKDISATNDVIAMLELSYKKEDEDILWEKTASIISQFFTDAFYRHGIMRKQLLMQELITKHDKFKNAGIETQFKNIIVKIVEVFCKCQGASFFMWDSFYNRYNLITTTRNSSTFDLSDVFYQRGEGITGWIGERHKSYISNDVQNDPRAKWIWCEIEKETIKTAMFIPITHPSIDDEVIGILRFVNKKNRDNANFIDHFNDVDVELMESTLKYLSLIIDFYLNREEQSNFISKMSHEIMTPARSIRNSAYRLRKYKEKDLFLEQNLDKYLEDIIDFAEFQLWQAKTNIFLSKNRRQQPLNVRYSIKKERLSDILTDSKQLVNPIARKYNVTIDKINVSLQSYQNLTLNMDRNAFITVFYNLFTNAIKYHDKSDSDGFFIETSCRIVNSTIEIDVKDNGVGINPEEKEAVFQVGYRGRNVIKKDAHGFGVGLPVVKQIINDFGGKISIISLCKPTNFRIVLPLK